jgi:hypothetical protein
MEASGPGQHHDAAPVKGFDLLSAPIALARCSQEAGNNNLRPLLELILALTGGECVAIALPGDAGHLAPHRPGEVGPVALELTLERHGLGPGEGVEVQLDGW